MNKKVNFSKVPAIIAIVALIVAISWAGPYGYYTLMKFIVTAAALYYAYYLYATDRRGVLLWTFISMAVLFNPIIPIYLYDKTVWAIIDIAAIAFFTTLALKFYKTNQQEAI